MYKKDWKTTEEIKVPEKLVDQIIGQDKAVSIIKKAAKQKRSVLLIGPPGTGKSMLAQAMAELMPREDLEDVLVYPNPNNENQPRIRVVKTYPDWDYLQKHKELIRLYSPMELRIIKEYTKRGEKEKLADVIKIGLGRRIANYRKTAEKQKETKIPTHLLLFALGLIALGFIFFGNVPEGTKWLIIAIIFGISFLYILSNATAGLGKRLAPFEGAGPKLIVDNTGKKTAPFIDATGAKAGALLGDVKHDPLQTGGLGTPAHLRVEAGAIQLANKGVLFIDEIASLKWNWQQELLTAMQEKKYPITGQSENSSGALVKTEPVPTDFVLVAAGNLPDIQHIHPALRSRIRGSGYEVYVEESMEDNEENRKKMYQFVAQEIKKDGKIPHFTREAVEEVIKEAKKMSGRRGKITLNLREVGGLIRAAGDIAKEKNKRYVELEDVIEAKDIFTSVEEQLSKKIIERKKEYQILKTKGSEEGRVNGLAVLGGGNSGLVLPIVAEITPSASKSGGKVIATGKLGEIAKEAVENVSAIIKKSMGPDIVKKDIHIQFLQTYEGVEGDSASISIAVAVISALWEIPVRQDFAMTGSLDIRGKVLPVGGITPKIEAAYKSGIKNIIIPKSNRNDVYLEKGMEKKIKIYPVENIIEVLELALEDTEKKKKMLAKMKKVLR